MVGGPLTFSVAVLETLPTALSLESTPLVVLLYEPAVLLVTSNLTVQVALPPAMVPPDSVIFWPLMDWGRPQVLLKFSVEAKFRLVGSVSVRVTPVRDCPDGLGLVMTSVTVEVPPFAIAVGLKALVMVGDRALTVRVSLAPGLVLLPPLLELTCVMALAYVPRVVPVTLIVIVHVPPPAMVTLLTLRLVLPGLAVMVGVPQPLFVTPGELATCIWPPVGFELAGKLSVKLTPVSCVLGFGLMMWMVSVEVWPTVMGSGLNDLSALGGPRTTRVRVGDGVPAPVLSACGAVVTLLYVPAVTPLTVSVMVQLAPAASEAPLSLMEVLPLASPVPLAWVSVPPLHVVVGLGGIETLNWPPLLPVGRLSVMVRLV